LLVESVILFHATGVNAVPTERAAIVLGLITLVLSLMVFASCRSCVSWLGRIGLTNLVQNRIYRTFYRYHAYYWWLLGISLLSHLMMAVIHTGWPQADDPDAGLQWASLAVGFVNLGLVLTLFSSCRISPRLIEMAKPDLSVANRGFRRFFQHHSYYWGILLLVVAGHIAAGYLHAGIWPG
jgi:hypothetical protein